LNTALNLADISYFQDNPINLNDSRLISYYTFNEGTGTILNDQVGGNNGQLGAGANQPQWTSVVPTSAPTLAPTTLAPTGTTTPTVVPSAACLSVEGCPCDKPEAQAVCSPTEHVWTLESSLLSGVVTIMAPVVIIGKYSLTYTC